jgi:hypothetical protein
MVGAVDGRVARRAANSAKAALTAPAAKTEE